MKTKTGKVVCSSDYNVFKVDIPITAHFSILSFNPGLKNKFKAWKRRVRWDDTCILVGSVVYEKVLEILSNCDDQTLRQKSLVNGVILKVKTITEVNKSLEKYRLRVDCLEVKDEKAVKSPEFIKIEKEIIQQIIKYCEDQAIYDKLGKYGDFYYNLKKHV